MLDIYINKLNQELTGGNDMKKYWMCFNESNQHAPIKRHNSLPAAQEEAARFVKKTGDPIDILECMQQAKPQDVPVIFDFAFRDIPSTSVTSNCPCDFDSNIIPGGLQE